MTFSVKLIHINHKQTNDDWADIKANCTHVEGPYWIYEGDEFALSGNFVVLDHGFVECLGGLSKDELLEVCDQSFPGWVRPC